MVIPSGRVRLVVGVEFAQDGVESAVVFLTQYFDPMADQECSADPLPRLVTPS